MNDPAQRQKKNNPSFEGMKQAIENKPSLAFIGDEWLLCYMHKREAISTTLTRQIAELAKKHPRIVEELRAEMGDDFTLEIDLSNSLFVQIIERNIHEKNYPKNIVQHLDALSFISLISPDYKDPRLRRKLLQSYKLKQQQKETGKMVMEENVDQFVESETPVQDLS